MAKKKAVSRVKKGAEKAWPVQKKTEEPVVQQPEKKSNKLPLVILAVVAFAIIIGQIVFVMNKQIKANKRPVLITHWKVQYGVQTAMPVAGNSLFIIDSKFNQIKRYDKTNGQMLEVYQFENTPKWAWESNDGSVFASLVNDGNIYILSKDNKHRVFAATPFKNMHNFVIDSRNILILSDGETGKLVKYSPDGSVVKEFGGKGAGKGQFQNPGRVFIDSKDYLYMIDGGASPMVKVFSDDGVFKKEWALSVKKIQGLEGLAITDDGNVYVNDWEDVSIKVFNNNGKVLGKFKNDHAMTYKITPASALSGGQDNYIYINSHTLAQFAPIKY